jgi:hypothetical protein
VKVATALGVTVVSIVALGLTVTVGSNLREEPVLLEIKWEAMAENRFGPNPIAMTAAWSTGGTTHSEEITELAARGGYWSKGVSKEAPTANTIVVLVASPAQPSAAWCRITSRDKAGRWRTNHGRGPVTCTEAY